METEKEEGSASEKKPEAKKPEKSDREKRMDDIREETYKLMKDKPEVKEFLKPYHGLFSDLFIQSYARHKSLWMEFKDHYKERKEEKELELRDIARAGFTYLMKKKMSDLRREWGAGLLELPGISNAFDFMTLVDNPFAVSWIPPINEAELQCLLDYVDQHKGYDLGFLFAYDSKNFSIPLYFYETAEFEPDDKFDDFHSVHMDTAKLRLIPDKRGEDVWFYVKADISSKQVIKNEKIEKGELPPEQEPDERPFPPDDAEFMEAFIKRCDDWQTLYRYGLYKEYHKKDEEEDENGDTITDKVETILARLKNRDVILPVAANADWRVALIESWNVYRKKSISDAIVQVYEEFLFHVEAGIAFHTEEIQPETIKKVEALKEQFLNGRELMGKPRDFNI